MWCLSIKKSDNMDPLFDIVSLEEFCFIFPLLTRLSRFLWQHSSWKCRFGMKLSWPLAPFVLIKSLPLVFSFSVETRIVKKLRLNFCSQVHSEVSKPGTNWLEKLRLDICGWLMLDTTVLQWMYSEQTHVCWEDDECKMTNVHSSSSQQTWVMSHKDTIDVV